MDQVPTSPVAFKPTLSHNNTGVSSVCTADAATSYHAPVRLEALPSPQSCDQTTAGTDAVDLEMGQGSGVVDGIAL